MIDFSVFKAKSVKHYVYQIDGIVALVVVLSYTFVLHFYFIQGLDEATFQSLNLESNHFVQAYKQDKTTSLPNSIHFKGYLNWQQLPENIKVHISELKEVSEREMLCVKLRDDKFFSFMPKRVIFAVVQPLSDDNTFYLIKDVDVEHYNSESKNRVIQILLMIWPLALFFFVIMFFATHFLLKRTLVFSQRLGDWIESLSIKSMNDAIPNFEFDEFNRIAKQQQAAMLRINEVLEKEQVFLRHASHELRTPIAVVKSNSMLLERLLSEPKAAVSVARIKRAALTMQYTTETLLWLSREETGTLATTQFDISSLLKQLVEDNQYLLQSKAVTVHLELTNSVRKLTETPCRLVLNNLLRNALQYTMQGEVYISNNGSQVIIKNSNSGSLSSADSQDNNDYGYGLGLILVDKIVRKMGWAYQNEIEQGGRIASIDFSS